MKRAIPFSVLLGCVIYCLIVSHLLAQSPLNMDVEQYVQEEWTVENGLSVGHINQIYQTPDGYIWLATFNGLISFNGLLSTLSDVSTKIIDIKKWLGIDNNGQHLVDVWIRLNKN